MSIIRPIAGYEREISEEKITNNTLFLASSSSSSNYV
jgi:hypothetical protein